MNKYLFLLLAWLGGVPLGIAQETPASIEKSLAPTVYENTLLWRISGQGLKAASYLYGTIHMIGKSDFFLSEATKKMFAETDRVTFEINMEDMSDLSAQLALMMDAFMKDGTTLKDLLDEDDYKVVNDHFKELGLPLILLERIKPMFLSVFASGDVGGMGDLNSGDVVSYEMELMQMAKEQKKEIDGLETAEYQMSMFDSIPYKSQAQMLVESIKAENSGDEQFKEMVKLYKNQDLQGMQSLLSADGEGIGEYEDILLGNRNRNWVPVIVKMMEEKPTFFAIGAGHLGGDAGVVALLRQEGYILTPINPTKP